MERACGDAWVVVPSRLRQGVAPMNVRGITVLAAWLTSS